MLTTLLPPTSGSATIVGYDIVRESADVRRHIGYVPQLLSADGSLTGYENMLLSARLYSVPRHERATRIARALARMGLSEAAERLVGHYSGGMIRRLEIAQSLLHRPKVLFLDEPTVGLDPGAREAVWDHVLDLRSSFRTTLIVTSHHMDEIDQFCDRIGLIDRGRIVAIGKPDEFKARVGPDATLDGVFIPLVGTAKLEPKAAMARPDAHGARPASMGEPTIRRSKLKLLAERADLPSSGLRKIKVKACFRFRVPECRRHRRMRWNERIFSSTRRDQA
jgi:ABC-2 type transport system ATP-binding protein